MVADPGVDKSCYSVNHGAGRAKGRKAAMRLSGHWHAAWQLAVALQRDGDTKYVVL
jgi:hypothetical protein